MKKTLGELAVYLKEILVPQTQEAYAIREEYTKYAPQGCIREGVLALRAFLERLFDVLILQGDAHTNTEKAAHAYENRTTLSVYYPFLHHINVLLMKIGYDGVMTPDAQALMCDGGIFEHKLSAAKNLECLRFLMDCGMLFEGICAADKKQNLADIKLIKVSYPDNPALLMGLKIMATAQIEHGTLVNQDVFLRCDYRVLKKDETDPLAIVLDTIKPLSAPVQNFILHLHRCYLEKGLKCVIEIKGFHIYIKYCYQRKDVWGVNASLNNGYHINVKTTKTDEYAELIRSLPPFLRELIAKGYGCGRKRAIGHCDGGCRGMLIPLDDTILDLQEPIMAWFDQEVSCLSRQIQ